MEVKNLLRDTEPKMRANRFYNEDCIEGCIKHIKSNSIDLIVTDPPYGIEGHTLHKHYNRKEEYVLDGYIEVPKADYGRFSEQWIGQAERILRPGGSMYIVSGYTNLNDILSALKKTKLKEINHIIWKFNFGVHTTKKFVSSHYHILFYCKPGGVRTFNTYSRFGSTEKDEKQGSLNYQDREDVWIINREYKPGMIKNKNELPKKLLIKMIQYSSVEGDIICDLFLGGFSTAKVAIGLNRFAVGFEKSKKSFDYQIKTLKQVIPGSLLADLRIPKQDSIVNKGKAWSEMEMERLFKRYEDLYKSSNLKKQSIELLCKEFKRGYFSILNVLEKAERSKSSPEKQQQLFDLRSQEQ
ncbi:MAG: site-specific DNA-methyltransferase [Candidatus Margulisiibacteriota bacterium]